MKINWLIFWNSDSPDEPKDVKIDKYDASSVTLKWKAPTSDGGNPIKGMLILVTVATVHGNNRSYALD